MSTRPPITVSRVDYVVATMGMSPGVAAELVNNLCAGRVHGYQVRGTPREVVLVTTENPDALRSAQAALAIINCCLRQACRPASVRLAVIRGCSDVTDRVCFKKTMSTVGSALRGRSGIVLVDVTGGRSSMSVAAVLEVLRAMLGGQTTLLVSVTELDPQLSRSLATQFNALLKTVNFDAIISEYMQARDCSILARYGVRDRLCSLFTGRARTAIIYP